MSRKIIVNMASESEISVQGHGVHTAYEEMVHALERRSDIELICGRFGESVDCDIVHMHTVGSHMWRKLFQKGPKKVVSAHVIPDSFMGSIVFARYWKPIMTLYLRWFYNRADLLLAVSEETKTKLQNFGITSKIRVLHNFIDTARYKKGSASKAALRERFSIPNDAFVVIGAGQVQPRKRVNDFIEVAKKCPSMYFIWLGGMPFGKLAADSSKMEHLMKAAPKNVWFPGVVPLETMNDYYHTADAFFLPSEQETFGLVVIEAAAAGLPVVLRDIPDYHGTFDKAALLGSSVKSFTDHLQRLSDDKEFYKTYRQKSRQLAERFDSRAAADELKKMYQSLLSERGAA